MGLVMMEASPFSPFLTGAGGGCVYSVATDAQGNNTDLTTFNPTTGETVTDITDDLVTPESGGTIFDEITQTLERSADSVATFISVISGGYITEFIEKTAIGCEKDTDSASPTFEQWVPIYNPVWDGFKAIFHTIIGLLTVVAIFYILSGRGFLLSS